jgi:hypothetical protein
MRKDCQKKISGYVKEKVMTARGVVERVYIPKKSKKNGSVFY